MRDITAILGLRRAYVTENVLTAFASMLFFTTMLLFPKRLDLILFSGVMYASPAVLQIVKYWVDKKLRSIQKAPFPSIPLITVILSTLSAVFVPYLLPVVFLNIFFAEDVSIFLGEIDVVKIKKTTHIVVEPFQRRELATIFAVSSMSSIVSFIITRNPFVLTYMFVSYLMTLYSVMYVPHEVRAEIEERRVSFLEDFMRRIPFLYMIFRTYYMKPERMRIAREAGVFGAEYVNFLRKTAGLFVFTTYISISISPILYALAEPFGLGLFTILLPLLVSLLLFYAPQMIFSMKRSERLSKINRNILMILSYFASSFSVSETFTNSMFYLYKNTHLSRLFGLENECKIYVNIYRVVSDDLMAMEMYSDTIPDDFWRDTVKSVRDIIENEGFGAAFRNIVDRLTDYTGRFVDKVKTSFESIGSNVISVSFIMQCGLPILLYLTNPVLMPFAMVFGGILTSLVTSSVAKTILPDLPSEFIFAKPRMKRAAVVYSISASVLSIVQFFTLPDFFVFFIPLNMIASFSLSLWYAYRDDFELNKEFLTKFPDLLILFSSIMSRTNSIERTMLELSEHKAFPEKMRRSFRKLANLFAFVNIEDVSPRGPFWYKYFIFISSISGRYGSTPRELYSSISKFMLEFKKLVSGVVSFSRSMLFLVLVGLIVMTLELQILVEFSHAISGVVEEVGAPSVGFLGAKITLPVPKREEIVLLQTVGYVCLLVVSVMNGFSIGKVLTGSYRYGVWAFILFMIELVFIIFGYHYGFGLRGLIRGG